MFPRWLVDLLVHYLSIEDCVKAGFALTPLMLKPRLYKNIDIILLFDIELTIRDMEAVTAAVLLDKYPHDLFEALERMFKCYPPILLDLIFTHLLEKIPARVIEACLCAANTTHSHQLVRSLACRNLDETTDVYTRSFILARYGLSELIPGLVKTLLSKDLWNDGYFKLHWCELHIHNPRLASEMVTTYLTSMSEYHIPHLLRDIFRTDQPELIRVVYTHPRSFIVMPIYNLFVLTLKHPEYIPDFVASAHFIPSKLVLYCEWIPADLVVTIQEVFKQPRMVALSRTDRKAIAGILQVHMRNFRLTE